VVRKFLTRVKTPLFKNVKMKIILHDNGGLLANFL